MYININKKFLFLHVPKTAGSSIHIFFKDYFQVKDRSDPAPEKHHRLIKDVCAENKEFKNLFKFAVVRNPYDRFISGFNDFYQNRNADRSNHPIKIKDGTTFEDFCFSFVNSEWSNDIHFKPAYEFVTVDGEIAVDKIIKFENLVQDFSEVCDILKIDNHLFLNQSCKHRQTSRKYNNFEEYYSKETKKIVYSFYQKDFELFNYEM